MPADTARHREQRQARFAVRSGTVARRQLTEVETLQLLQAIDKRKIEHFGVRQLHCIDLNDKLPTLEGCGVAWMDEMTMLDYASWRGRDHIAAALVRGGADPHPVPTGACRAALEALPQEGLVWLLRAVVRMRFASKTAAGAHTQREGNEDGEPMSSADRDSSSNCICDCCGASRRPSELCLWTSCGHRRCLGCVWSGVTHGDPDSLMLRCAICQCRHSTATTVQVAEKEIDQFVREQTVVGGSIANDCALSFAGLGERSSRAVRNAALHRGLFVQERSETLQVSAERFPFRAGATDLGQLGPVPNRRGKKLTAEEEGPDWTCAICSYDNWRRRDTCRNCSAETVVESRRARRRPIGGSDQSDEGGMTLSTAGASWAELEALNTPEARKLAMVAKWDALPTKVELETVESKVSEGIVAKDVPKCTDLRSASASRMTPEPPAEAMLKVVGATRAQRSAALLQAAGSGDLLRLRAVLVSGCDVEATDECGQTAAFVAAWRGHVGALQLLRWVGANLSPREVMSKGGISIASAAAAVCHCKSTTAVADCLALLGSVETTISEPAVSTAIAPIGAEASMIVSTLIPPALEHPGAGALVVDKCFNSGWLEAMDKLYEQLPLVGSERARTCAVRSYHCDVDGFIADTLRPVVECALQRQQEQYEHCTRAKSMRRCTVLPRCRFLAYLEAGGDMQPHVDLSKQLDEYDARCHAKSTHTFMVHLADCDQGGETVFLSHLNALSSRKPGSLEQDFEEKDERGLALQRQNDSSEDQRETIPTEGQDKKVGLLGAAIPRRGRLVIFPHACPHAGMPVLSVPKKFLRGELLIE